MILFKPEHVEPILSGRKTQTRRLGQRRWKRYRIHQCRTRMLDPESTFAHVRILDVRREFVRDITEADARAEGYDRQSDFLQAFAEINRTEVRDLSFVSVWVVEFERVDVR